MKKRNIQIRKTEKGEHRETKGRGRTQKMREIEREK